MTADMTRAPAKRPLKDGTSAGSVRSRADHDRFLGRFMALCACATVVLFVGGFATAPASERQGLLPVAGLVGVVVALALWFLKRGFSRPLFVVAGVVLMALGVMVGAEVPDGLDAAVILPLTGALIVLPVLRGRLLLAMFVLAFAASIAGEIVAHIVGGMSEASGSINLPISLAASAVMLAFTYGLAWWVSNEWLVSSGRTAHALTGERHLLALNERLVATLDPQQVLNLIADSLKSVVAYDNLTIYRVDRDQGLLRPVLARDRFASLILENTFTLDHGITGWVVTHAEAQCVNDAQRDPRMSLIPGTPAEDESLIVVPLVGEGDVVGTLNVGRMGGTESHFDSADFEMAQLFASQASIALLNAETHRAVATRAETDALTGLHNRRAFDVHFPLLLADPRAQPLTLLMLDLDGFKAFNDGHGHPAGDALLREVAQSISAAVRAGDRVYRHGGDEFAVLLPATAPAVGAQVAERIRAAITMLDAGAGTPVTASVGAASSPDDATTCNGLVAAADAALYRAKESGGDRVAEAAGSRALATSASASPRTATLGPAPAEILGRVRAQPHRP
jgi:diguanylate cyclase (GGDEF)-like protein